MTPAAAPLMMAMAAVALVAGVRAAVRGGGRWRAPGSAVARRMPGGTALGARLHRAGVGVAPDAVIGAVAGISLVSALSAWVVLRSALVAVAALAAGPVALRVFLASADRRHMHRVADAMPAVAQMLANAVAAGLSLRQAVVRVARDTPPPLAAELQRASTEMDLGARVDDALSALAARLPDPDLGLLVTAILVQRRTGGDLARALRDMSSRLEERARLARELRGATAQARATAWMVAALPLMGAALAEAASPGLIARTAAIPVGFAVLVGAAAMQAAGILIIRRIAVVRA
jgi:tight adherence protein B